MKVSAKHVTKRKAQKKHMLYHCPEWNEVRREIPEAFRKWEQKARTSQKEWKWQRGILTHTLGDSQWNRRHFSILRSPRVGACQKKGSKATLQLTAGKWRACGLSVVQLDFDEELGPLQGVYGSMDAELEVRRTIKRAKLTAFLSLLKKK